MTAVLTPDELAASCYRAFLSASGLRPDPWEGLALEHQAPWLRVALHGEAALLSCEGRHPSEGGAALAALQARGDPALLEMALGAPRNRLAYEALARHLLTLIDGDGSPDLPALEASWADWATRRRGMGEKR